MKRWHAIPLALLLVTEILAIGVHGTFASFQAQVNDPGSSVQTASILLTTTNNSQVCESYGGSVGSPSENDNSNCGALAISAGPYYPGQSTTETVTVTDNGTEPGSLSIFTPDACGGTGLCNSAEMYLEDTTSSDECYYPVSSPQAGACSYDTFTLAATTTTISTATTTCSGTQSIKVSATPSAMGTIYTGNNIAVTNGSYTCNFSVTGGPYASGTTTITGTYTSSSGSGTLSVGSTVSDTTTSSEASGVGTVNDFSNTYSETNQALSLGTLAVGATRTFVIGLELPAFSTPSATAASSATTACSGTQSIKVTATTATMGTIYTGDNIAVTNGSYTCNFSVTGGPYALGTTSFTGAFTSSSGSGTLPSGSTVSDTTTSGNTYQGESASLYITWYLTQ